MSEFPSYEGTETEMMGDQLLGLPELKLIKDARVVRTSVLSTDSIKDIINQLESELKSRKKNGI